MVHLKEQKYITLSLNGNVEIQKITHNSALSNCQSVN